MPKRLLSALINYVLPMRCASCSELTLEQGGLCSKCFSKLNFITNPYCKICGFPFDFEMSGQLECGKCIKEKPKFDLARSLFKFDQNSKNLIHVFKYNDQTAHAKAFARLLIARYQEDIGDIEQIVPVPMNRYKRLFRNYNPAQILASEVAKLLGKPMIPDILIKKKWTKAQTNLSKAERQKNLSGSLEFNKKYDIKGRNILLIDDVKTTGTTCNSCSSILKRAGAKKVVVMTVGAT